MNTADILEKAADLTVRPVRRHPFRSYIAVALLTFAWEASAPDPCDKGDVLIGQCPDYIRMSASGYMAAIFWPLYWLQTGAVELRGGDEALRAQGIALARETQP